MVNLAIAKKTVDHVFRYVLVGVHMTLAFFYHECLAVVSSSSAVETQNPFT